MWVGFWSWRLSGSPAANFVEKNQGLEFWHITRLILSGCISGRSRHAQSLRSKILHRSIKKIMTFCWKRKKLEQKVHLIFFGTKIFEKFRDRKISIFFIGNCMKNEKNWDRKKSKIFDLENFHFHTNPNENFRKIFEKFWSRKK